MAIWILAASLTSLAFGSCATTGGTAPKEDSASATTLVDPLNDFSLMYSHSADLDFDVKNPATWQNGDASRLWPTSDATQSLVYKMKGIKDFAFMVGYYTYKHQDNPKLHGFKAFVSSDGGAWSEVQTKAEASDNGCFLFTTYEPAAAIPAGMDFAKFEFWDKDLHWSTEVSEVHLVGR